MSNDERKLIAYISGKISGDQNYKTKFAAAEKKLKDAGHVVLNPTVLPEGMPYEAYMQIAFALIDVCDTVIMLPDWTDSIGATRELAYASAKAKKIWYLENK